MINPFFKRPANKLTLISDSHGRDLIYHLDNQLANTFSSFGLVLPNARLENVISAIQADKKITTFTQKTDYIVWIGGRNDIFRTDKNQNTLEQNFAKEFVLKIEDNINKFSHTNLIIASIPYRYDLPHDSLKPNNLEY